MTKQPIIEYHSSNNIHWHRLQENNSVTYESKEDLYIICSLYTYHFLLCSLIIMTSYNLRYPTSSPVIPIHYIQDYLQLLNQDF